MNSLLKFSDQIDRLSALIGSSVKWLILIAVIVSAGNALSRYLADFASNSMLELQWYLFAAVFTLAAGYTMKANEHVRIDVLSQHLSPRTRNWIDFYGLLIFVIPVCTYIALMSIPNLIESFQDGETSQNAGGLIRWPIRLLIPVGFGLLVLQSISEVIKRYAFLKGLREDVIGHGGHAIVSIEDVKVQEPSK